MVSQWTPALANGAAKVASAFSGPARKIMFSSSSFPPPPPPGGTMKTNCSGISAVRHTASGVSNRVFLSCFSAGGFLFVFLDPPFPRGLHLPDDSTQTHTHKCFQRGGSLFSA